MVVDANKVGKLFTINGDDAWRLVGFCEYPTATFENLETKQRIGGAVQSPNITQFKELGVENDKR